MPRGPDSGQIDLSEVFHRVQQEMLAQLAVGRLFEHASAAGAATEHHWLELFDRYLPKRYRASPLLSSTRKAAAPVRSISPFSTIFIRRFSSRMPRTSPFGGQAVLMEAHSC